MPLVKSKFLSVITAAACLTACLAGHVVEVRSASAGRQDSIDVRGVGFRTPASAIWDATADVYLVSNINGHPLDKDDNGFISRVLPTGVVQSLKWIDGASETVTLNAPKGLAIVGDRLWVTDIDVVRGFDLKSGRSAGEITVEGASFLNDLVPTGSGQLLISDTGLQRDASGGLAPTGTARLVTVNPAAGRVITATMLADLAQAGPSQKLFGRPSGVAFLVVGVAFATWDTGILHIVSVLDRGPVFEEVKLPKAQLDGVVSVAQERRSHGEAEPFAGGTIVLVSSREGNCVYEIRNGKVTELITNVRTPADIGYDARRNRVLVPLFMDDALLIRPGPKLGSN